jgi:hypothetical protein
MQEIAPDLPYGHCKAAPETACRHLRANLTPASRVTERWSRSYDGIQSTHAVRYGLSRYVLSHSVMVVEEHRT